MTKEELDDYIKISTAIYNSAKEENFEIQEIAVVDGVIQIPEEE